MSRRPARAAHIRVDWGMLAYFVGAAALGAGVLALSAVWPQPSEEQLYVEQLVTMKRYLAASAERELVEREAEEVPQYAEGGTGTRAKAEEGNEGSTRARNKRYAVQGSQAYREPRIARQAALREAQEFGLIGLLNTGAAGDPNAPQGGGLDDETDQMQEWGAPPPFAAQAESEGGEEYADHGINQPIDPTRDRMSTFAIDVDTGSYTIAKRKLDNFELPPLEAVRVEEFVNAFDYGYAGPEQAGSSDAFAVHLDAAPSPFGAGKHVLRVALQAKRTPMLERPPVHLVYLVDTSGSMQSPDKLGLAQHSLRLLTRSLNQRDSVAICTYAGSVRELLSPTPASDQASILAAIDELAAEGSTAMASGIDLAYGLAARSHSPGHISRVVVLSDGDANVGPSSAEELLEIIRRYKQRGITLSTVGYGQGNYKDATMERLADAGDGNYSYIGTEGDARRVFVDQVAGLLQVVARDVKVQVEFDPRAVETYRLLGYENRDVADHLFRDDGVDGGEIGAGHSVTALYELRLRDTLLSPVSVHVRHKPPLAGETASEITVAMPVNRIVSRLGDAPQSLRFAVAVAAFADALRGSPFAVGWSFERIRMLAEANADNRPERTELLRLVDAARALRNAS